MRLVRRHNVCAARSYDMRDIIMRKCMRMKTVLVRATKIEKSAARLVARKLIGNYAFSTFRPMLAKLHAVLF